MKNKKKNKKKITQSKKAKKHPEAKGLFYLTLAMILLFAQISFVHAEPQENWLGIIGYSLSWIMNFLFGWGSFLLLFFFFFVGIKHLLKQKLEFLPYQTLFFTIFFISTCILLNVFAETHPNVLSSIGKRMYTETFFSQLSTTHFKTRYNLGGVPFYYLYTDLPYINLQKLLTNFGTCLFLSIIALVTFFLFTGIETVSQTKKLYSFFYVFIAKQMERFLSVIKLLIQNLRRYIENRRNKNKLIATSVASSTSISLEEEFREKKSALTPFFPPTKKKLLARENQSPNKTFFQEAEKKSTPTEKLPYHLPTTSLLFSPKKIDQPLLKKELKKQAHILERTLKSFGIDAQVGQINCGPTITSFEVHPSQGVKVQRIKALENDIALNLQAKSIRIIAPIPGKAAVGVEVPSIYPQTVSFKEMLLSYRENRKKHLIPLLLGKTVHGEHVTADLTKMPHCLIAGATGSGKSVCINTIVMSILMNTSPDNVKLMMIDPKKVELTQYSELPHMIAPVITEPHGAYAALQWLVQEMQKRYEILKKLGLRNILAFNKRKKNVELEENLFVDVPDHMPFIVGIIDEFADLILASSTDLETPIARIAQMARAVGIHLILATQRPSREVITGIIKANFPCRVAFKVASRINSQIILDETGAETLLGNGDLLFLPPGTAQMIRAQGAFINDEEINRTISAITQKLPTNYLIPSFDSLPHNDPLLEGDDKGRDKLYDQALTTVLTAKNASTTFLQRKLKIGYARAASLMDELEENGVIGPQDGSKPRRIIYQGSTSENFFEEKK